MASLRRLGLLRSQSDIEWITASDLTPILGTPDDPKLPPESLDALLLVDAHHELAHPFEMMQGIRHALRPGGRVFLIEYRSEDPRVPIKPLHKMTQAQAITEPEAVELRWVETRDILPTQHFMVFEKPTEGSSRAPGRPHHRSPCRRRLADPDRHA